MIHINDEDCDGGCRYGPDSRYTPRQSSEDGLMKLLVAGTIILVAWFFLYRLVVAATRIGHFTKRCVAMRAMRRPRPKRVRLTINLPHRLYQPDRPLTTKKAVDSFTTVATGVAPSLP